jgi:hypothetical protein
VAQAFRSPTRGESATGDQKPAGQNAVSFSYLPIPNDKIDANNAIGSHDCHRVAIPGGGVINEGTIVPVRQMPARIGYPYHVPYRAILLGTAGTTGFVILDAMQLVFDESGQGDLTRRPRLPMLPSGNRGAVDSDLSLTWKHAEWDDLSGMPLLAGFHVTSAPAGCGTPVGG